MSIALKACLCVCLLGILFRRRGIADLGVVLEEDVAEHRGRLEGVFAKGFFFLGHDVAVGDVDNVVGVYSLGCGLAKLL
jgi:hypothetical protein